MVTTSKKHRYPKIKETPISQKKTRTMKEEKKMKVQRQTIKAQNT